MMMTAVWQVRVNKKIITKDEVYLECELVFSELPDPRAVAIMKTVDADAMLDPKLGCRRWLP